MYLGRRFFVVLVALAATSAIAVSSADAGALETPKVLDLRHLTLGSSPVKDTSQHRSRTLAGLSRASWWGGTYYTSAGEPVQVNVSDLYAYNPAYPQSIVNFLGSLTHGRELSRLTVWIAPLSSIEQVCGGEAVGCYDSRDGFLQVIGDDVPGYSVEQVLMHEYGHHVATNRSNAPWPAVTWGTKRWASYENVCTRTQQGVAFPGDEGDHYWQNPGEAFAESYMFLNAQRFGVALPPWDYDVLFQPDYNALTKITQDVTTPWNGNKRFVWRGRFGRRGTAQAAKLATPLDGDVSFRVSAPRGTLMRVYADGQLLGTFRGSAAGRLCGQRSVTTQLVGGGKGAFRVLALIP